MAKKNKIILKDITSEIDENIDVLMIENIMKIKKHLNISMQNIAMATNMSTTTISRYLNGKKKITNEWVNRFCNYYHVDKKWLENGSGEPVYISFLTDSEIKKSSNAGKRLVQLRSELGLKQEDVYIILGITRAMYSRIENGHAGINTEYAKKIEDHFGIGSEWLLYGDESKKYYPVSQKLVDFLWSNIEERKRLWLKMRD